MPELPEVETIRRGLAPRVEGRTVAEVTISDPRWCAPGSAPDTEAAISGRRIERVERRGKYLLWQMEGARTLAMHLRMTGTVLLDPPAEQPHTRVRFTLDDGTRVAFSDPRRFGTGHVLEGDEREAYFARRLGLEPFDEGFTAEHLYRLSRTCRAPIKAFLLDQKRIAGVGNIYADEALHRARIHPLREAAKLTRSQAGELREAVRSALEAGIAAGGATIDDFRHSDGARGSFQDEFLVHRREGKPCPECGTPVRKLVAAGRGTYVCESCQPPPRRRRRRTGPGR